MCASAHVQSIQALSDLKGALAASAEKPKRCWGLPIKKSIVHWIGCRSA